MMYGIESRISEKLRSVINDVKSDLHHRLLQSMPEIDSIVASYIDKIVQENFSSLLNKLVGGPALVLKIPENITYETFGHLIHYHDYSAVITKLSPLAEKEVLAFLENRYKELRESPTQYHYHVDHQAGLCSCGGQLKMIVDHTNLNAPSFTICFKCHSIFGVGQDVKVET